MNSADTFEDHLATPILIHSEMDESAFRYELARMKARESATAEFVRGELDAEDYFEVLADCGIDIDTALADWSRGISYMS
jgi:hypothetical protein